MNCDIFIPIRLKSQRLPNKAIIEINGKPIALLLINRLLHCKKIRKVIVCTTKNTNDDPLVNILNKEKIEYFRGDEKDVLKRFLDAAQYYKTDYIVNVDGDDIYTDTHSIEMIVDEFERTKADYIYFEGLPLGLTPAGINVGALRKLCELKKTTNTETGYRKFFTENKQFKCIKIDSTKTVKFPKNVRLTLDYPEDLKLATIIFGILGNNFHWEDITKIFKSKPELIEITKNVTENWQEHWNTNLTDLSLKDNSHLKN